MKKYKLDPADEQFVMELLQCKEQPEKPLEAKLNTETFRNYEKQRADGSKNSANSDKE